MSYPAPTTGLGVAAKINVAGNGSAPSGKEFVPGYNDVTLSLSGTGFPTTFQLNPEIVDVDNNSVDPGTAYTLSAVASSSGNTAVYTGTGFGATNALVGQTFLVAGFVATPANNGTFIATANTSTTLTLENAAAVAETHAATATSQETVNELTYFIDGTRNYNPTYATGPVPTGTTTEAVATVSADGLITAQALGGTVVEVSFPTFNNTVGATGAISPNPMYGLPKNKIYAEVNVTVVA